MQPLFHPLLDIDLFEIRLCHLSSHHQRMRGMHDFVYRFLASIQESSWFMSHLVNLLHVPHPSISFAIHSKASSSRQLLHMSSFVTFVFFHSLLFFVWVAVKRVTDFLGSDYADENWQDTG